MSSLLRENVLTALQILQGSKFKKMQSIDGISDEELASILPDDAYEILGQLFDLYEENKNLKKQLEDCISALNWM